MNNCILLRYGEIGLKSKNTRAHFEKKYVLAIADALKRNEFKEYSKRLLYKNKSPLLYKIKNLGGRFIIYSNNSTEMLPVLQRVPGIQSLSPAVCFNFSQKEDLLEMIKEKAISLVQNKTFCVRVKRIGEHHFTSQELEKEAGSVLYDASQGVDLHQPEITIFLEIRKNECYFYTNTVAGLGGLPPKASGKVLALFSGGIDSPVAALQMLKRGCEVDFLFVNLLEEKTFNDVAKVYNFLIKQYAFSYQPKFYVVNGKELVNKIKSEVPDNLKQIAIKIVFYQIGELIAEKENYPALVTGESLSQKSSQTLLSLKLIDNQINTLVLRPLLAEDKLEITKIARSIGTLGSSEKVKESCSLAEGKVSTAPHEEDLQKIPSFTDLIAVAVKEQQIYFGMIEIEEEEEVPFDELQGDYVLVDIRPKHEQEKKVLDAKIKIPYPEIMAELTEFKRDKQYLIICDFGVLSDNVAFALRKKGIKALGTSLKNYNAKNA